MKTHSLKNEYLALEYLASALRISALIPTGRSNLFADLRDAAPISTPYGEFQFLGGHRLWHSPEAMPRTYIPDAPVAITELSDGVALETPTEPGSGVRKHIEIHLAPDRPSVLVVHTLTNDGLWPIKLAPWAITQFRTGGVAILPQAKGETGLLPNRILSFWPYSDVASPEFVIGNEFILIHAAMQAPFKIGFPNPRGWLAYWIDETLFIKRSEFDPAGEYGDFGSSSECYSCKEFLELETLAPLCLLEPGSSASHTETWEIYSEVTKPENEKEAFEIINRYQLD